MEAGTPKVDFENGIFNNLPKDWDVVELRDIAKDFFSGGTPSTKRADYWDGNIEWTTSAQIGENASSDLYIKRGTKRITDLGLNNSASKLVPNNNLLIGTRVGVGKVAINAIDIAISQDLTALILARDKADPEYISYAIRTGITQKRILSRARGTTIKGIPRDDLKTIPIPLPCLPEQRAIAHVLSTVREVIEDTERVIAAARELKRSLMRHLFTYGPVTVGEAENVLLKETEIGNIPKEWEIVNFGDLISDGPQNGLYKPQTLYGEGTPIIRINDYANEGSEVTIAENRVKISEDEKSKYGLATKDILINRVNSLSHIGKAAIVGELVEPMVFESNMMRLRVDLGKVLPDYAFRYLTSCTARGLMRGMAKRAVAQSSINQGDVKSLIILLPQLREQGKIISYLQDADTKIDVETIMRNSLKALFESLLHHLMTGKIRVPI
jgi:type I restriction enzyme S subunit